MQTLEFVRKLNKNVVQYYIYFVFVVKIWDELFVDILISVSKGLNIDESV